MIISASRRTDIPAFYAPWFMNRLRAGFCLVANPINPSMVTSVSLAPEDVDVIVFWSKNPAPLIPHLAEIDERGFDYYFLFTLNDYPGDLEPNVPPLEERLGIFRALSDRIGPAKTVWRYDPIILSKRLDADHHLKAFGDIASALSGHTQRVIISVVDFYRKTGRRLAEVERETGDVIDQKPLLSPVLPVLIEGLAKIAAANRMEIQSCAEEPSWASLGVAAGGCIDDRFIRNVFGIAVTGRKDPSQRESCRCVVSKDIGAPDSCLHGCEYCYATRSHAAVLTKHGRHDPAAEAM